MSARPSESQRAIDEWDIDVVHIHSVSSASTTIVVLALFSANYSLVKFTLFVRRKLTL